jgi:hypothetical protein
LEVKVINPIIKTVQTTVCCLFIIYLKNTTMAKYSEKAGEKVEKTMHEMKEGKLKSGSGKKVTSKKQAVAIGLSEARKEGAKVPKKK